MNPLYSLGISLYATAARLAAMKEGKARLMVEGHRETFDRLKEALRPDRRYVWIHAASLGEFEQGRPLIERIRAEHPELGIVLSFFSPSGYEVRKNYSLADVVVYLPFDTPGNARRFVETVNPVMAIFVKYEFWGNYLETLHSHNIPTYLISAIFRPGQIFFRPWGGTFRKMLGYFTRIFVQDENSRKLLEGIGVRNVTVAGDTRFDRVTAIMNEMSANKSHRGLFYGGRPVVVFGSSWEADEAVYVPWLKNHPDVQAIIAPHEFDAERLEKLRAELTITPGDTMLLTEYNDMMQPPADGSCGLANPEGVRVIIVNSFGLLSRLYGEADFAYVGGGFGVSIHNINEAAVYGIPVIFGPRHQKFREAAGLIGCGGGFSVNSRTEFEVVASDFINNPDSCKAAGEKAGKYIRDNIGATDKILNSIFKK